MMGVIPLAAADAAAYVTRDKEEDDSRHTTTFVLSSWLQAVVLHLTRFPSFFGV